MLCLTIEIFERGKYSHTSGMSPMKIERSSKNPQSSLFIKQKEPSLTFKLGSHYFGVSLYKAILPYGNRPQVSAI